MGSPRGLAGLRGEIVARPSLWRTSPDVQQTCLQSFSNGRPAARRRGAGRWWHGRDGARSSCCTALKTAPLLRGAVSERPVCVCGMSRTTSEAVNAAAPRRTVDAGRRARGSTARSYTASCAHDSFRLRPRSSVAAHLSAEVGGVVLPAASAAFACRAYAIRSIITVSGPARAHDTCTCTYMSCAAQGGPEQDVKRLSHKARRACLLLRPAPAPPRCTRSHISVRHPPSHPIFWRLGRPSEREMRPL